MPALSVVDTRRSTSGTRRPGPRGAAAVLVLGLFAATLTACGDDEPEQAAGSGASLTVTSPAFKEGERIPNQYSCRGTGERPALAWSGEVDGVESYAVVVDDPDAPGFTYLHWVVFDIPAQTRELPAGDLPDGVLEGQNSAGRSAWAPPCPPSGEHRYRFHVYALKARSGLAADAEGNEARKVIEGLAVATGTLTGLFG
ncbi:YbhB/YbcL family Raf kinase inhibitor-like protein [Plantactinospora sonchi]|uniref:YbhB/YbcL family Raf kinase inhibitor-like protein n=1 Tax=Plantactinospora sonchi TaxID=1544735 RepID=A0ABU7RWE0_9ACTN